MNKEGFCIAIPAYGRVDEFKELLNSIYSMSVLPNEIIICEDKSKERKELSLVAMNFKKLFLEKNCELFFIENENNLGYDANIRKLIHIANYKWVVLIGNDDVFLKDGLRIIKSFVEKNPDISMISRPFLRFDNDIKLPLGLSKISDEERIFASKNNDSAKFIFRSCGFVGGLVINREWAIAFETSKFDGSLYYQIYLACHAFCTNGIGYLKLPTVGGRTGNPPLFGSAKNESEVHIPGSYTAKGRAKMWKSVLEISKHVGLLYKVDLYSEIKKELMVRQSFHVFEMNVGIKTKELIELKYELKKLELFNHFIPRTLFLINLIFKKRAYYFYKKIRKVYQ